MDRRSVVCTTCRAELPAEWIMTKAQTAKMMAIDRDTRAEHRSNMKRWNQIKSSSEVSF